MNKALSFLQISALYGLNLYFAPIYSQNSLPTHDIRMQVSWQQHVNHDISATLDEKNKYIRAEETIEYTNNSPGEMREIWLHIWPNAFANRGTGYGKEAILNGNMKFYCADNEKRGFLDSLNFTVNGEHATFKYHPKYNDIIRIDLPKPLISGQTAIINTPFRVKIPWLFSRMGYNEKLFSITQWYPKPAVYDVNGWNLFPMVDQGEYYSEFGDYKVSLDVPGDFKVAATGELQDLNEKLWLEDLADSTSENGIDQMPRKTLHYVQKNVSDFAWFANPEFKVSKGICTLPSGRKVTTFAFYEETIKRNIKQVKLPKEKIDGNKILASIDKALTYYSQRVGEYPYDYCTVVIGPLQGAGGMEYPMITICADASEGTTVHEVGHNWFQGMLGSQERDHPWMDESINTFYQNQATGEGGKEISPGDAIPPTGSYSGFRLTHDFGVFQKGNLPSDAYTGINYGTIVYGINPQRFLYLQDYLGKYVFDSCMHSYFRKWQYHHPLPGDMQEAFEKASGKSLDWFFNGLIGGTAPDVAIRSVKYRKTGYNVKIKNKGKYDVPVKLTSRYRNQKEYKWVSGDTTIFVSGQWSAFSLNASGYLPESNLANNDAKAKGLFRTWGSLKAGLPYLSKRGENRISLIPWPLAFNTYDGYMPGVILTNVTFPRRNWEWWATPMYGLKSKTVTGYAGIRRNIFHKNGLFSLTEISLHASRFSFHPDAFDPKLNAFNHFSPKVTFYLKRKKAWVSEKIQAEYILNRIDRGSFWAPHFDSLGIQDATYQYQVNRQFENNLFRIGFVHEGNKKLIPVNWKAELEGGMTLKNALNFWKFNTEGEIFITYPNKGKKPAGLRLKGWFSGFLSSNSQFGNTGIFGIPISGANGYNDYGFRQTMLGRTESFRSGNNYSNQLLANSNSLRMFPSIATNKWVFGTTIQTSFIPSIPLQFFLDAAIAPDFANQPKLNYVGGLTYRSHTGNFTNFEVNLPLVYSQLFNDFVSTNNANPNLSKIYWYSLISFRVSWDVWNPFTLVRGIVK